MYKNDLLLMLSSLSKQKPQAAAQILGSSEYPQIAGHVYFYQTRCGVVVSAEVSGLPTPCESCGSAILGFHIHEGSACSGNEMDPFADSMTHYNPCNREHPYHAGDFPPLFGNNGYAFQVFLTNRFCVKEIIGKTVIVHSQPDDFTTQPSGNSGAKIACGEIKGVAR